MLQGKRGRSFLPLEKLFVAPPAAVAAPEVDPFPADEATGGTEAVVPPAGKAIALPASVFAAEIGLPPADEATGGWGADAPPAGNAVALPADVLAPEVDHPSPPMRL